jgi:hypothetical protein
MGSTFWRNAAMHKFAALALTAALGIAGMGYTKPAEARVFVGVGIGLPGVYAYPPVGVYAPYYPYYYGPGYTRFGYGYGFRGGYGGFRGGYGGFHGGYGGFRGGYGGFHGGYGGFHGRR